MGIRKKLMVGSLLTVLVPMFAMLVISSSQMQSAIHDSYQDKVKSDISRIVTQTIPDMMDKTINYLSFLSMDANLLKAAYYATSLGETADIQEQLQKFKNKLQLSFLEISGPDGKILSSTMQERVGLDRSGEAWFASIKETNRSIRFFFNKETGEFHIDAAEVITRRGEPLGYLYGGYWFKKDLLATLSKESIVALYGPDSVTKTATETFEPGSGMVSGIFQQVDAACQADIKSEACKNLQFNFSMVDRGKIPYIVAATPIRILSDRPVGTLILARNAGQMAQDVVGARQTALMVIGQVTAIFATLAILAAWFYIRTLSTSLNAVMEAIFSSSTQIASSILEQERITAEQAASVYETNTSMEELSASSRHSAEQADRAATGAQQAMDLSKQGLERVAETLHSMEETKERVEAIAQQILVLSRETGQIRDITGLVSDFANETKMLAMNAAVEAVRAGEHGKGFSVLAIETRKLAEESKRSAGRINDLVTEVQKATNATVMATEEGGKSVNQGMTVTQHTADTFRDVADAVRVASEGAQQISMHVRQQSTAIKQVVESMRMLNTGAKKSESGISQVKTGIQTLNHAAKTLREML